MDNWYEQVLEVLRDSLETLEHVGCIFFACPGTDGPDVDMATCHVCSSIKSIRRSIEKLEVLSERQKGNLLPTE